VVALDWARRRRPATRRAFRRLAPAFRAEEDTRVSGPVWLWLGYAIAAWGPAAAATGGILAAALADPAAALVGRALGGGARKSWAGTTAAGMVGLTLLLLLGVSVPAALAGALTAAALERWSGPLDDNLLIAPGVTAVLWLVS